MLKALPSLTQTYRQAFRLYFNSFIYVLPFLLFLILGRFALEKWFPQGDALSIVFFTRLFLDIALTSVFFSFILYSIYQQKESKTIQYAKVLYRGVKSSVPIFVAYVIISLPILLTLAVLWGIDVFWQPQVWTEDLINLQRYATVGVLGFMTLLTIILATFSFIAGVFIVVKQYSIIASIKESWSKIKLVWLDTLLLLVFFGILTTSANMLLEDFHIQYAAELMTLVFSSLYPCLMLVRFDQLESPG
jgi:hypothetical protein